MQQRRAQRGDAARRWRSCLAGAALVLSLSAIGAAAPVRDLTCNAPTLGALGPALTDMYQFDAMPGEAVALEAVDLTGTIGLINLRLHAPNGDVLIETCNSRITTSLPQLGTYTLEVSDCVPNTADDQGHYTITLSPVSATFGGRANCGTPVPCNVAMVQGALPPQAGSEPALFGGVVGYTLTAVPGRLQVQSAATSPTVGVLELRLYAPTGELLADTCDGLIDLEVGSGVYTLLVNACTTVNAGDFTLGVSVPCELSCDLPLTRTVQDPNAGDAIGFSVSEGESVAVSVVTHPANDSAFFASWVLVDVFGQPVFPCNQFLPYGPHTLCGPLTAAGSPYYVAVNDSAAASAGVYDVVVQRVTAGAACDEVQLTCSVTADGSIDAQLDTDLLSFSVADGDTVAVTVVADAQSDPAFIPAWRILDAAGNPVGGRCGVFATAFPYFPCDALAAAGNPYRIEVGDNAAAHTGSYRALITSLGNACATCQGDCDGSGSVSVDELVRGVRIALGPQSLLECPSLDVNLDGAATVDELVGAINRALRGCSS